MSSDMTDGLGLGMLGGVDLSAMLDPVEAKFLEIDIDLIMEDGENPRSTFDPTTLQELAETIQARGVITPISVRPDPAREGGYIVNHGHRRLRAAKLAALSTIPAVIDDSFRDEDRIIENIQRDNLDMFEVANFIGKKLADGMKQKEVAKLIGKSTAYVSQHTQLLELPAHTGRAVKTGQVTDLTTIADLVKAEKEYPDSVELFLAGENEVTRTAVRKFRIALNENRGHTEGRGNFGKNPAAVTVDTTGKLAPRKPGSSQESSGTTDNKPRWGDDIQQKDVVSPSAWRQGRVVIEMDGRRGVLQLDRRPHDEKHVWVEWEDGDGKEKDSEVPVSRLSISAVVSMS